MIINLFFLISKLGKKILLILYKIIVVLLLWTGVNATESPDGIFTNVECLSCHEKYNSDLVKDWQASVHAYVEKKADCVTCHGNKHTTVLARNDKICINCHGGKKSPVVHSYNTSKHGTLIRLEQYDWTQLMANYRVPSCSYCHMYAGNHNVTHTVRKQQLLMSSNKVELKKIQDRLKVICQNCHSPRYVTQLFSNGEAQFQIAYMKVREANQLITQASIKFSDAKLVDVKQQMKKMRQHLKNVYLGVGHQSPDYQWWHGQPALDGDLLRIKNSIGELHLKNIRK
ncbi:multiheme c-type cytochrome [Candidatus Halobeggiatoa sp. HSG11]|nr:multiheme c-type cytochrome [Candidatus Halobeggiatoa sp. HSG11]